MLLPVRSGLALLTALAPLVAQTPPAGDGWVRREFRLFALDLPESWREMTVDEAIDLGDQLPFMMRQVHPGRYYSIGDVDRWIGEGFDGRALLVIVQRFEQPATEETLDGIRRHWQEFGPRPELGRRELVESSLTTLGPDRHPAIECAMVTYPPADGRPIRALEFYASTSGQQLILSFRSWEDDQQQALPRFRRMADSLTFARPPQEPEELGSRLVYAGFIGALVGLVLLALWKMRSA